MDCKRVTQPISTVARMKLVTIGFPHWMGGKSQFVISCRRSQWRPRRVSKSGKRQRFLLMWTWKSIVLVKLLGEAERDDDEVFGAGYLVRHLVPGCQRVFQGL